MREQPIVSARGLVSLVAFSAITAAQCGTTLAPGPGNGLVGQTHAMTEVDPDGGGPLPANLIVGNTTGVWQWDATTQTWSSWNWPFASLVSELVTMPNGDVVAAGTAGSGQLAVELHRFDGTNWTPLLSSIAGSIGSLHALPNGDLLVGGRFTSIDGVPASGIARWDGTSWTQFGGGVGGPPNGLIQVRSFCDMPNGDLIVGGSFTSAGGVAANNIARWNGSTFSPLGSGVDNPGTVVSAPVVTGLVPRANGEVFACGMFQVAGGVAANSVAMWNGASWSAMGAGLAGPSIYYGVVTSAAALPNGDIVAGGALAWAGNYDGFVQRWTGTAWQPESLNLGQFVNCLHTMTDRLVIGGDQRWQITTPCPAQAVPVGAACQSSGGDNQLVAESLPWTGSTCTMTATGLPQLSLIAIDAGVDPLGPLPLSAIGLPNAPAPCMLHISPVYFEVALTTTGAHSFDWVIPSNTTFAGFEVYWQFVALEVNASLQVLESTSTNAIELTIGSF